MATTIHLIRHGAVQAPAARCYIGSTDLPLTELGTRQAAALGSVLTDAAVDAICISPLVRAQQTARLVFPPATLSLKQPPETVHDLREIDFGDWEELTFDEINRQSPDRVADWGQAGFTFPNGEGVADFRHRVCRCGTELVDRGGLDTIAIVAHAGVIQTLICHFLDLPLENHWRFTIDHASLTTVQLAGSFGSLKRMNFIPASGSEEESHLG